MAVLFVFISCVLLNAVYFFIIFSKNVPNWYSFGGVFELMLIIAETYVETNFLVVHRFLRNNMVFEMSKKVQVEIFLDF
jgi:hypothetical protein